MITRAMTKALIHNAIASVMEATHGAGSKLDANGVVDALAHFMILLCVQQGWGSATEVMRQWEENTDVGYLKSGDQGESDCGLPSEQ